MILYIFTVSQQEGQTYLGGYQPLAKIIKLVHVIPNWIPSNISLLFFILSCVYGNMEACVSERIWLEECGGGTCKACDKYKNINSSYSVMMGLWVTSCPVSIFCYVLFLYILKIHNKSWWGTWVWRCRFPSRFYHYLKTFWARSFISEVSWTAGIQIFLSVFHVTNF